MKELIQNNQTPRKFLPGSIRRGLPESELPSGDYPAVFSPPEAIYSLGLNSNSIKDDFEQFDISSRTEMSIFRFDAFKQLNGYLPFVIGSLGS